MTDVDEIIEYFKYLRRGFDKELFQCKIDELGYHIETDGINYEHFHTLFKMWLNLTIPIPNWVSFGSCLVPQEKIKDETVEYSLKWLLANYDKPIGSRIGFLLDWLTAAMDTNSVDMNALDIGYEIFYSMLNHEALTVHVLKLVYTLTKPADVTRYKVLELIDIAKKREGKKNMFKQIQVLLGLFKSYKPQCVPEDIPSISAHTVFKKINVKLLKKFQNSQTKRNSMNHETTEDTIRLCWNNPINSMSRNKKADPLLPNMEFLNIGSQQNYLEKNYLDFSDPVLLLRHSSGHVMCRPARLRALLCSPVGHTLLVLASDTVHALLSYDLHLLLGNCFLEHSSYSYFEKRDLLKQLASFQATLLQGLPVVTYFLAQYLPFWNEKDFFEEILKLIEWVDVEGIEHVHVILDSMTRIYHRAQPLEQCAIIDSLTAMYTNLVYSSTRQRHYYLSMDPSETDYKNILTLVASQISDMSNKALQVSPDSACTLYSVVRASEKRARFEVRCGRAAALPPLLPLALPLLSASAATLDSLANVLMLYKEILSTVKDYPERKAQIRTLYLFASDFVNCIYHEMFLSKNIKTTVFSKLNPQVVRRLKCIIPDVHAKLSIRNHLAFACYTYMNAQGTDECFDSNDIWFRTNIERQFSGIGRFLNQAL